jgi:pantothenate synthetase
MASLSKRNKYVVDQQKKLGFQMEREQQLARAAELAQEELNEEKKRMEEELKLLQSKQEQCWENTGKIKVIINITFT